MSPWARSGLTLLAVSAALAGVFGLRYARVQGAFDSINPASPGVCRVIAKGLQGPEDIEVDAAHDAVFVSVGGLTQVDNARDGIYRLKLSDLAAAPLKLAGTPADFHPHGISLYRAADGSATLMVIDHKAHGVQAIELYAVGFDGETPKLTQQTTIEGGLLPSPNDLSAIGPDRFYVTNDHATSGALGRFAEDYLLWPHADLVLFNGRDLRVAVQRIAYPNGVLATADGRFLYVSAFNERRLLAFSREPFTGNLAEIGALALPAKLDNISMDGQGNLIIAGRTKPASSQIFRVHLGKDGVPQSYDTLFSDDGHSITRASIGVVAGGHLLIGSSRDDHMLDCAIK